MKKILVVFCLFLIGSNVKADLLESSSGVSMENFWEKNGKEEQKIIEIGSKIINSNKLDKRIPLTVGRNQKLINANSSKINKTITVYTGIFPYIDNDDELAFVLSHEMAHSLDAYDGLGKWFAMWFNSKEYEYKADLIGVDLMTKAGYNPVAAITSMNKFFPESYFDFGILTTHPKTSKRMLAVYKYIYKKYPSYLSSEMTHNINYVNFTYSSEKDIILFKQIEKEREKRKGISSSL